MKIKIPEELPKSNIYQFKEIFKLSEIKWAQVSLPFNDQYGYFFVPENKIYDFNLLSLLTEINIDSFGWIADRLTVIKMLDIPVRWSDKTNPNEDYMAERFKDCMLVTLGGDTLTHSSVCKAIRQQTLTKEVSLIRDGMLYFKDLVEALNPFGCSRQKEYNFALDKDNTLLLCVPPSNNFMLIRPCPKEDI